MPRPLRIEYPGAAYHVMARGNQGQSLFGDDRDRVRFLESLGESCAKTGWRIHVKGSVLEIWSKGDAWSQQFLQDAQAYSHDLRSGNDLTGDAAILAADCDQLEGGSGDLVLDYLLQ